jgi:hypothetical protein
MIRCCFAARADTVERSTIVQQPHPTPVPVSQADVLRTRLRRAVVGAGSLALGAGALVAATTPALAQALPHLLATISILTGTGGPPIR